MLYKAITDEDIKHAEFIQDKAKEVFENFEEYEDIINAGELIYITVLSKFYPIENKERQQEFVEACRDTFGDHLNEFITHLRKLAEANN